MKMDLNELLTEAKSKLGKQEMAKLDHLLEDIEKVGASVVNLDDGLHLKVNWCLYSLPEFMEAYRRHDKWPDLWMERMQKIGQSVPIH